jgi:hypothetical protein
VATAVRRIPLGVPIAVLFGAGASFGYTPTPHKNPPLGRDLFRHLNASPSCPAWQHPDVEALFNTHPGNFETPMAEIAGTQFLAQVPPMAGRPSIEELTFQLCRYLERFDIDWGAPNFYSALLVHLIAQGRIHQTLLCSLNYECLLERSLLRDVHRMVYAMPTANYFSRAPIALAPSFPLSFPTVLKIHGSINFLPPLSMSGGRGLGGPENLPGVSMIGPIQTTSDFAQLRREYDACSTWLHPSICHYAAGKPPIGNRQVKDLAQHWEGWVRDCDSVIVIGANADVSDPHIWDPLIKSRAHIYYVGNDSRLLERQRERYHLVGKTFEEAAERFQAFI